jgi:two-component system, response regulator PdtaR
MSRVMIAEDDLVMADMLADVLVHNGYEVCGIARTVDKAVDLCEHHEPDLAILDLLLAHGDVGTEIAARLERGNPCILHTTGNVGQMGRLTKADGEAALRKPYRPEDAGAQNRRADRQHRRDRGAFPRGIQGIELGIQLAGKVV